MHRPTIRLFVLLCAAFALVGAAAAGAIAQGPATPPHPSHIHAGTCDQLDPNPAFPLTDVAAVSAEATRGDVEVANSTVAVTLDELLAAPYAINVHESAEAAGNYIACGNIAGPVVNGLLLIPMREQNGSGYAGIAALAGNDAGGTNVSVYLAPDLTGTGAATPAVTPAASPVAVEEEAVVAPQGEAGEVQVAIANFAFDPPTLEIPIGTTVTWTNNDSAPHTATSSDGVWDSGILNTGDTFSYTFDQAGTFNYICSVHPNMTAQIVVTAS